jgi:hypothetical protein
VATIDAAEVGGQSTVRSTSNLAAPEVFVKASLINNNIFISFDFDSCALGMTAKRRVKMRGRGRVRQQRVAQNPQTSPFWEEETVAERRQAAGRVRHRHSSDDEK